MATIDSLQDSVNTLTSSTTALLDEVNVSKATLIDSKDLAETAATSATTQAANAASSASAASSSASSASASATAAANSAASASAIVTGVATGMPSVRPSLNLDFVNSKTVDPRISFTRSTTATYYDGKTTAKAEENLNARSEEFQNWSASNSTVVSDTVVAPNGTTTADLVYPATTSWRAIRFQSPLTTGKEYTVSIYAKASGKSWLVFCNGGSGTTVFASWDVTNGTVGTVNSGSASIQDVGNGWYRCSLTFTATGVYTTWTVSDQDNSQAVTVNGTDGLYLWGAQAEERSSLTAYTPTTTSPITNYIPVLQTAAINEPRLDHDPVTGEAKGLLIEESRTNLLPISNANSSAVVGLGKLAGIPNPWGEITPKLTETYGYYGNHRLNYTSNLPATTGATYTFSFYAKKGDFDRIAWHFWGKVNTTGVHTYTFSTGAITAASSAFTNKAEEVGNGWVRISSTWEAIENVAIPAVNFAIGYYDGGVYTNTGSSTGDGYSGFYVDGIQFEQGSFPTSYIPTSGASVTRARDYAELSATSWISQSKGTMYFDTTSFDNSGYPGLGLLKDSSTSNNYIGFYHNANSQRKACSITWNGSNQANFDTNVVGYADKLALAYSVNDTACAAGSAVVNDTTCLIPVMDTLKLGVDYGSQVLNGYVKQVMYYPERVADSEILSLTSN